MSDRASLVLGLTFVVLGTLFTLSPELLSHSPIGFEKRGAVHHMWHYVVLIGGLAVAFGAGTRDRLFESVGLIGCGAAVFLNLAAAVTAGDQVTDGSDLSGFGVGMRIVVLFWIAERLIYIRREDR